MTPLHTLLGLTIFGLVLQRGFGINVPIGEDLARDQVALAAHQQQQFQPISNGNSRYQIFKIHNHYVSPSAPGYGHQQSYARSPLKQEIRIQHVNLPPPPPPPPAQHAHHQEDINVSYVSFAAAEGPNGQQITVTEPVPRNNQHQVGVNYLPPVRQNADYVPDYRSQRPEHQHFSAHHEHHQHHEQQLGAQQYFGNSAAQNVITAPHTAAQPVYKGPDYLPPLPPQGVQQVAYQPALQTTAVQTGAPAQQSAVQYDGYQGCGYNKCQSYSLQAVAHPAYKGPDYLPPPQPQGVQQVAYQPPLQTAAVQAGAPGQQSAVQYDGYKGYNGCGNNKCKTYSLQAVAQVASHEAGAATQYYNTQQDQSVAVSAHFKGPDYLPPHVEVSGPTYNQGAGYLPPHNNPEVGHTSVQVLQPNYVQHYTPQLPQSQPQQYQQQVLASSIFTALPAGYEFDKPENAEQAIAELHSQQIQQQQQQQQQQAALAHQQQQRAAYSGYSQQQQQLANHAISYQQPQQQQQHHHHASQYVQPEPYRAPAYLPPVSVEATAPRQHQNYQQEPQMHSLSSYMTSVQPYQRYGYSSFSNTAAPRSPFAQYGPPAVYHSSPTTSLQIAPMYREPATRPSAYAPAMSYKANAVPQDYTTFTLHQPLEQPSRHMNKQTLQALQSFMPKDIQAAAAATGKVRTVQIVNSRLIKTLKVLETHDNAGVKTIKILGNTNESPLGTHQIVRVVSPSKNNALQDNVDTVKIFNDHKDVALAGSSAATVSNNAYLPPAAEVEKKRSVRDSRKAHALPQAFGRPR